MGRAHGDFSHITKSKKMEKHLFTEAEERLLRTLLSSHTVYEVAHVTGRSVSSIRNKMQRMGLSVHRPAPRTPYHPEPRVYISAPITGHSIMERRAFFAYVAKQLAEAGFTPINPFDNGLPEEASHAQHMKADIMLLLTADAYVQDPASTYSAGCEIETAVADACDIPLIGTIHRGGGLYIRPDKADRLRREVEARPIDPTPHHNINPEELQKLTPNCDFL